MMQVTTTFTQLGRKAQFPSENELVNRPGIGGPQFARTIAPSIPLAKSKPFANSPP